MNTHNVNVKTATKKSSERWVKTSYVRTDGFVRNIHSSNPGDVIRTDVVVMRLEKKASHGCGCHYEIWESNLLNLAMDYLSKLPIQDRPAFIGAASRRGITLTIAEKVRANSEKKDQLNELATDY